MNLTGGLVLFLTIWFMSFLTILPIGHKSQSDAGHVVPGTPASAPAELNMRRKVVITTLVMIVIWAICAVVLISGWISMEDVDWVGRLDPREIPAATPAVTATPAGN